MEQLGDLTYILAFADKFQDLEFTVAKSLDRVGLVFGLAMREFCNYLCGHGRAEVRASIKNLVNCVDHIGHRFVFHHVAFRPGPQGAQCVERFIMHGKHQNRQIREFCSDVFDKLNPVCSRQTQVDDRKIRIQLSDHLHPFGRSPSFTANRKTILGTNQLLESFSKQRVIIDDDDSFRVWPVAFRILVGRSGVFHFSPDHSS
jgi:hypothetical protein